MDKESIAIPIQGSSTRPQRKGGRFLYIDALRGIAALMVAVHHGFNFYLAEEGYTSFRFMFGARAVQIFLIISGFVIAHSLRHTVLNFRSVGNFMVRRFIRLTPVYWLAIGVTLFSCFLSNKAGLLDPGVFSHMSFSFSDILVNGFYLQGILAAPLIAVPAWVLCLEVQFYAFYVALLWLVSLFGEPDLGKRNARMGIAMFLVGVIFCFWLKCTMSAWVIQSLTFLAFGSVIYAAASGAIHSAFPLLFPVVWGCLYVAKTLFPQVMPWAEPVTVRPGETLCLVSVVGLSVLYAVRFSKMEKWSGGRILQYFGTISYSLYLIHLPVMWGCRNLMEQGFGFYPTTSLRRLLFVAVGVCASTLCAHIVYRLVEKPTADLASRLRPRAS